MVKEKRQNEHGRTVPYSARASQKVQERIARTLPGASALKIAMRQHSGTAACMMRRLLSTSTTGRSWQATNHIINPDCNCNCMDACCPARPSPLGCGRGRPAASLTSMRHDRSHFVLHTGSGHRLFLISRNTVAPLGAEGGPVEEFVVLGATGAPTSC